MIVNSTNSLIDLASAISAAGRGEETSSATYYEIASLWKRSKSFRDRVLAVYADVLSYILNDGQQTSHSSSPELTKYGNNRLTGDIGDFSGLTVSSLNFLLRLFHSINCVTHAFFFVDSCTSRWQTSPGEIGAGVG